MSIRVECINKAGGWHQDPHEAISRLAWVDEQSGQRGSSSRAGTQQTPMGMRGARRICAGECLIGPSRRFPHG